jgi:ribonuclease-3
MGRLSDLLAGMAWWRRESSDLSRRFFERFGIKFSDPGLLEIALTHRSSLGAHEADISNERLEFLGDSVLGLVATESLFKSLPDADEGTLTKARSRVVNKNILGKIGLDLGLLEVLKYARDEIKEDDRALLTLSADGLEAVIGAIYLDKGFEFARRFVHDNIIEPATCDSSNHLQADHKSQLQEISQAEFKVQPQYKVVKRVGPEHRKIFHVEVMIRGKSWGTGVGRSKKEAEQQAAGNAMRKLGHYPEAGDQRSGPRNCAGERP